MLVIAAAMGCASPDDDASKQRCETLRSHLITLRLQAANDQVNVEAHREALKSSLGSDFVDRCQERPAAEVNCALAANNSASVADCSSL